MSSHRVYTLKVRADRLRETRERIVAATEELHREVGPARTTIADIARRAGVERLTVYNHFPELSGLLRACQSAFLAGHPPPDISLRGVGKKEAMKRLESALVELYGWFRANASMEANVHRDRSLVPELDELLRTSSDPVFDGAAAEFAALVTTLRRDPKAVRSLIRVAMDFRTWQLATHDGTSDREAARTFVVAIRAIAGNPVGRDRLEEA